MTSVCPLCSVIFDQIKITQVIDHLSSSHKLIINKIHELPESELPSYLSYWKNRFNSISYTDICPSVEDESKEEYFILCPLKIPEEKLLRNKLNVNRIEKVLKVQEKERNDNQFTRQCLFCKQVLIGNRSLFLDHLGNKHNFSIGHPDNLVYIEEFIDVIDAHLKKLKCLWCEGSFKTWDVLKEHMRKKNHRQLNPDNKKYDKYYLVNYLEPGKDWRILSKESPSNEKWLESTDDQTTDEWNDWIDDEAKVSLLCLFCSKNYSTLDLLSSHLNENHKFDFTILNSWPFYKKIRLINFIRQCSQKYICFYCRGNFDTQGNLENHLHLSKHSSLIPEESIWLTPSSFRPVNGEDALLYLLESFSSSHENEQNECKDGDEPVIILPQESEGLEYIRSNK